MFVVSIAQCSLSLSRSLSISLSVSLVCRRLAHSDAHLELDSRVRLRLFHPLLPPRHSRASLPTNLSDSERLRCRMDASPSRDVASSLDVALGDEFVPMTMGDEDDASDTSEEQIPREERTPGELDATPSVSPRIEHGHTGTGAAESSAATSTSTTSASSGSSLVRSHSGIVVEDGSGMAAIPEATTTTTTAATTTSAEPSLPVSGDGEGDDDASASPSAPSTPTATAATTTTNTTEPAASTSSTTADTATLAVVPLSILDLSGTIDSSEFEDPLSLTTMVCAAAAAAAAAANRTRTRHSLLRVLLCHSVIPFARRAGMPSAASRSCSGCRRTIRAPSAGSHSTRCGGIVRVWRRRARVIVCLTEQRAAGAQNEIVPDEELNERLQEFLRTRKHTALTINRAKPLDQYMFAGATRVRVWYRAAPPRH